MRKYIFILPAFFALFIFYFHSVSAEEITPTPEPENNSQVSDLQNKINELQAKISELEGQKKTLNSQISVMDSQINLTELKIQSTQAQISELALDIDTADKKIDKLENSLDKLSEVLVNRIKETYVVGSSSNFQILLAADSVTDFVKRASYLRIAQAHDKKLIYDTVQARNDYATQKDIYSDQKTKAEVLESELSNYQAQLEAEKQSKATLLAETEGSEANYQRLLAAAEAQLAAFSNFTQVQGGASLLDSQTQCDDWGCYYNQRDSSWGGNSLNGTGYSLASDGCLVTSMAMIYTHYGHRSVTPQTINSISSNFASYYPAYLKKNIYADGVSSNRIYADIDSTLAGGDPMVVGISYDSGPLADHFVVFVSGSGGNYTMKDPFTPNGNNISFNERYPGARIVETERVSF